MANPHPFAILNQKIADSEISHVNLSQPTWDNGQSGSSRLGSFMIVVEYSGLIHINADHRLFINKFIPQDLTELFGDQLCKQKMS